MAPAAGLEEAVGAPGSDEAMNPRDFASARATSYRMAFREWFGLAPAQADILVALYLAGGAFVQPMDLAKAAGIRPLSIYTQVCTLRATLETEAIDCVPRQSYRLTDSGMAECRAALWTMGEELRRAS